MIGKRITIKGNVHNENGVINFDRVDGNLTNFIDSIPSEDLKGFKTAGIKQQLEELKAAILAEPTLSGDLKEEALQQVANLAEAVKTADEGTRKVKANMALSSLESMKKSLELMNDGLASAAKLADSMKVLLPLIGAFFGLV